MKEKRINRGAAITKLVIWSAVALILLSLFAIMMLGEAVSIMITDDLGIFNSEIYSDEKSYNVGNMTYSENIKDINIHWVDGSINFVVREGEKIEIAETVARDGDEYKMRSRVVGDRLEIRFVKSGLKWFKNAPQKDLTIYLPPSVALSLGDIEIESASAKVSFGETGAEGDVAFDCNRLNVECASGNVKISKMRAERIDIAAVSAGVDFVGSALKMSLEGVSGELSVAGNVTELDISTVSSRVNLALDNTPSDLDLQTVSGNIDITLPESESGFEAELDTVSGSMSLDSNRVGGYYRYGNGTAEYDFETVSGSVNIKIKKVDNND